MFKFLIILCVILYILYKIGSMFFRAGAASQNHQRNQEDTKKQKKGGKFKGGEYIDYEEVK